MKMKIETLERRLRLLENPDVIALLKIVNSEFIENRDIKEIKDMLEHTLKVDISAEKEKIHKNQYKLW
jgi:hypothetical protein